MMSNLRLLMMSLFLSGAIVPSQDSTSVAQTVSGAGIRLSSAEIGAIDGVASRAIRDGAAAGLVVAVSRNGAPVFVRGYGFADLEHRVPVTESTVFRIDSVTKQFTAAALLLLAERGLLSVDDPLSKYYPTFPRGQEVTLRQLLIHTSGIHNYTADGFFREAARTDRTTDELVAFIAALEKLYDFEPGTKWSYSNSGYVLLGGVIEKVSGQPFGDFLKANILDPLGLRDTAIDNLAEIVPHRARGYEAVKGQPGKFANASFISMSAATAAGAMRSTPADLLKWHSALLGGKVLKPDSLAMMVEPALLKDGRLSSLGRAPNPQGLPPPEYGFGLTIDRQNGRRMIGHGGSINGFNAWINTYPDEGTAIVLLTNTGGAANGTAAALTNAFFNVPADEHSHRSCQSKLAGRAGAC